MPVLKNPSRAELLALMQESEWFRAMRDPVTGDLYAWPGKEAMHAEMVQRLGINFRTIQELKRHSFLFWRSQIEEAPEAGDLADLARMIAESDSSQGQP